MDETNGTYQENTIALTPRNMRLLTAVSFMEDLDESDLNKTIEKALLNLRDDLLHGPTVVTVPAEPVKRGPGRPRNTDKVKT